MVIVHFGASEFKVGEVRWGMYGTDILICFTLMHRLAILFCFDTQYSIEIFDLKCKLHILKFKAWSYLKHVKPVNMCILCLWSLSTSFLISVSLRVNMTLLSVQSFNAGLGEEGSFPAPPAWSGLSDSH